MNHLLTTLAFKFINIIMKHEYYLYYYLRAMTSEIAEAGTPYYVGIGKGKRINRKGPKEVPMPIDKTLRVKILDNLDYETAKTLEIDHIKKWGRVDLGTGILRNKTNGGDGTGGRSMPLEERYHRSVIQKEVQNRPEVAAKRAEGQKISNSNPETKKKRSESAKSLWADPVYRKKHKDSVTKSWSKDKRKAASERAKEYWSDPTNVEEKRKFFKDKWKDLNYREKRKETFSKTAATEEFKKKKREVQLGLKFWNNGEINIRAKECPQGFTHGRIKPKKTSS